MDDGYFDSHGRTNTLLFFVFALNHLLKKNV